MTDYICDSSAGVDGVGTLASPFNNANGHLGDLVPGDRMLLRGSTNPASPRVYSGQLLVAASNGCESGTASSRITVTNYPGEYAVVRAASAAHGISITGLNYWTITGTNSDLGLEIDQNGYGSACINVDGSDFITIEYTEPHNCSYDMIVRVRDSNDCTIQYNSIYDNDTLAGTDHSGIMAYPINSPTSGADSYRLTVRGNTITDCAGDCVVIERQSGVNNYFRDVVIEDNSLTTTLGAAAEQGLDLKSAYNATVRRNFFSGFRFCDGTVGSTGAGTGSGCLAIAIITEEVAVYDNVFTNYSCNGIYVNRANVSIYRNLFYGAVYEAAAPSYTRNHIYITHASGTNTVNVVKNTFVDRHGASNGNCTVIDVAGAITVNYVDNCHSATGPVSNTGGTLSYSYNGWFASPVSTWSGTGDVTGASAGFVSPATNDYRLSASSPCLDAGVVFAPFTDGFIGARPDIGYDERTPAAVAPISGSPVATLAYAPAWSLTLSDPNGLRLADLNAVESFKGVRVEMGVGAVVLTIPYEAVEFSHYMKDGIVELLRAPLVGGAPTLFTEQCYWIVGRRRKTLATGQRVVIITAQDANRFLFRRRVLYAAGSSQASKTGAAGNLMRAVVRENAGASAPAAFQIPNLSVGADIGDGASISKAFAWRSVGDVLRELAQASAAAGTYLSFDLVATSHPGSGRPSLEFRTYAGQRGLDHRYPGGAAGAVLLGAEFGTLTDVDYEESWADEINHVTALGPGQESMRVTLTASDPARLGLSSYALAQGVVDGRTSAAAALQDEADAALRAGLPRRTFGAQIAQTGGVRFGVELGFGDYVTAQAYGDVFDGRLSVVEFEYTKNVGERITPKLVNDGSSDA